MTLDESTLRITGWSGFSRFDLRLELNRIEAVPLLGPESGGDVTITGFDGSLLRLTVPAPGVCRIEIEQRVRNRRRHLDARSVLSADHSLADITRLAPRTSGDGAGRIESPVADRRLQALAPAHEPVPSRSDGASVTHLVGVSRTAEVPVWFKLSGL